MKTDRRNFLGIAFGGLFAAMFVKTVPAKSTTTDVSEFCYPAKPSTRSLDDLAKEVERLHKKIASMKPGDVLVAGRNSRIGRDLQIATGAKR